VQVCATTSNSTVRGVCEVALVEAEHVCMCCLLQQLHVPVPLQLSHCAWSVCVQVDAH